MLLTADLSPSERGAASYSAAAAPSADKIVVSAALNGVLTDPKKPVQILQPLLRSSAAHFISASGCSCSRNIVSIGLISP